MSADLDEVARIDAALTALANRERRRLLHDLWREGRLSSRESTKIVANGGGRDLDELRTELYHVHLPRLVDFGYVVHDEATGEVRKGPKFDEIAPLIRLMATHPDELPADWL